MKRIITLPLIMCSLLLTACNSTSIGVIGGADGPTKIYVSESGEKVKGTFGEQLEKKIVRMFNVDGELYYDSGLASENTPRCGTMDGEIKKAVNENEIPLKSGEANFEIEGYQNATELTKEVNIDGEWAIFRKFDTYGHSIEGLKYCYYIKGHLNNAAVDSEHIVLSDYEDVTFNDVHEPLLSSRVVTNNKGRLLHNSISTDKWGLRLYADDVTKKGMTIRFEHFGEPCGNLSTGSWYKLERIVNDEWQEIETKQNNTAWTTVAYGIKQNDVTEFEINWEFLYGELSGGYYRLSKEIMRSNFGSYDEEIYSVSFSIE